MWRTFTEQNGDEYFYGLYKIRKHEILTIICFYSITSSM